MELPPLILDWAANAAQTFAIGWTDPTGNAPYNLTGVTVRLVISPAVGADIVLNATTDGAGGHSTWTFTSGQSLPSYIGRPVRLEWVVAGEVYLMSQGLVVAA